MRIQPVILSGGAGTRLWPMSRGARPKQFLPIAGDMSLFQQTVRRVEGPDFAPPIVIGGARHADLIESQLREIGGAAAAIVLEPSPRGTAAAAVVAATAAEAFAPGSLVLLTPSDHAVADSQAFCRAVTDGAAAARTGAVVVFGVTPTRAHTGYGYVECGASIAPNVYRVRKFHEKPSAEMAKRYLDGGAHFWNAGIFLFSPRDLCVEAARFAPEILKEASAAFEAAIREGTRYVLDEGRFAKCPSESLDIAIMEKTDRAAVVGPLDAGWSDIGAWDALASPPDARVFAIDSQGAIIRSDGPFVGVIGAPDMIVIATGDAVLVAPKSRAQEVKAIVEELKARNRNDLV